jgi:hypothetical protein
MSGFFNLTEQGLLDYFVATYGATTKYMGLTSTMPAEDASNITEPPIGTGGYVRIATTSADWAAASGTAPALKPNTAVKTWPTATADWLAGANFVAVVLFTAATAGTPLAYAELRVPGTGALAPKPVLLGDTPSFAAGALVLKLGDPGDTYVP